MAVALQAQPPARRLMYLDHLKAFLIVLVILHHAGQPYGPGGWWAYEQADRTPWLALLFSINNTFFMSLMFFVSGYFLPGSFDRKGVGSFLRDRFRRLGIPLLVFSLLVLPVLNYAHYVGFRGGTLSFARFFVAHWLGFEKQPADYTLGWWPEFNFGHLWFVEHLLLYALVYAGWRLVWRQPAPPTAREGGPAPNGWALVGLAVAIALVTYPLRFLLPWRWDVILGFIQVEIVKLPVHMAAFILGAVAYRLNWLARIPAPLGIRWFWAGIGLIGTSILWTLLGIRLPRAGQLVVDVTWEAFTGVALSVGLLVLFRERCNQESRLGRWLGDSSFAAYLLQTPVLVALQYAAAPVPWGPLAKFCLVSIVGLPLTFWLAHLLRRIPGARTVL